MNLLFLGMTNPKPHYSIISEFVKKQIQEGIYPTGSLIPSENELCMQFDTSRMTVRQALNELVKEGFIERKHGKGSFVKSERQSLGLLSFKGFSEVVGSADHEVKTLVVEPPAILPWPQGVFESISRAERGEYFTLKRLRCANDVPVMLEYTYLPIEGFESLLSSELLDGSLFKTLSVKYNVDMRNLEQCLRAILADTLQSNLLKCPLGSPILAIERKYITNQTGLFVYSKLYCYTDHYSISNVLN